MCGGDGAAPELGQSETPLCGDDTGAQSGLARMRESREDLQEESSEK